LPARRSSIGFAEGRDTSRGAEPPGPPRLVAPVGCSASAQDPATGGCGGGSSFSSEWLRVGFPACREPCQPGGRDPRSPRDWWHRLAVQLLPVLPESAFARVSYPVSGALRAKPSVTVSRSSLIQTSRRP